MYYYVLYYLFTYSSYYGLMLMPIYYVYAYILCTYYLTGRKVTNLFPPIQISRMQTYTTLTYTNLCNSQIIYIAYIICLSHCLLHCLSSCSLQYIAVR